MVTGKGKRKRVGRKLPELPFPRKVAVIFLAWFFILLGIIGSILPILQGWIFFAIGLVLFSLSSEKINVLLSKILIRWPKFYKRYSRLRTKIHAWLSR